jgi:hypothetical protein
VRDGNATAMPADYLPDDYQAAAFNIKHSDGKPAAVTKKPGNSYT